MIEYIVKDVDSSRDAIGKERIVRCKDCEMYHTPYCKIDIHTEMVTIPKVGDNDYCSFGRRKEP